jgi:hypothetical protein
LRPPRPALRPTLRSVLAHCVRCARSHNLQRSAPRRKQGKLGFAILASRRFRWDWKISDRFVHHFIYPRWLWITIIRRWLFAIVISTGRFFRVLTTPLLLGHHWGGELRQQNKCRGNASTKSLAQ